MSQSQRDAPSPQRPASRPRKRKMTCHAGTLPARHRAVAGPSAAARALIGPGPACTSGAPRSGRWRGRLARGALELRRSPAPLRGRGPDPPPVARLAFQPAGIPRPECGAQASEPRSAGDQSPRAPGAASAPAPRSTPPRGRPLPLRSHQQAPLREARPCVAAPAFWRENGRQTGPKVELWRGMRCRGNVIGREKSSRHGRRAPVLDLRAALPGGFRTVRGD